MFITVDWSLLGNSRACKPTSEFQIAAKETMAEAFHLEVDGWDSEQDSTPLQDSVSENSSPGNEQSAKRRKLYLLICTDPVALCKWLTFFVAEVRKKDGTEYPPKTLYLLLTGILRHMRSRNTACPNFSDTQDPSFSLFHNALDNGIYG